jgi:hypothetical protein
VLAAACAHALTVASIAFEVRTLHHRSMSRLTEQMFRMQSWRDNYTLEREQRRNEQMLREIAWMLVEAVAVTAFLASFR